MVALNATVEAPISARAIDFKIVAADGSVDTVVASLDRLIIAGWAGRDVRAVEDHVRELAALGVKPPSSIPAFYQAGIEILTTAPGIQVLGPDTSGEVEAVFVSIDGDILVGVGSDHTDRRAEADLIALSKQMCPKPVSQALWRYSDVAEHWDSLVLRSYATIDGQRLLYQEGAMSNLQPPDVLFGKIGGGKSLPPATVMYGGTLSAIGGIRPMQSMELILEDPILRRALRRSYTVEALSIIS